MTHQVATVADLRRALDGLKDDLPVVIEGAGQHLMLTLVDGKLRTILTKMTFAASGHRPIVKLRAE